MVVDVVVEVVEVFEVVVEVVEVIVVDVVASSGSEFYSLMKPSKFKKLNTHTWADYFIFEFYFNQPWCLAPASIRQF